MLCVRWIDVYDKGTWNPPLRDGKKWSKSYVVNITAPLGLVLSKDKGSMDTVFVMWICVLYSWYWNKGVIYYHPHPA